MGARHDLLARVAALAETHPRVGVVAEHLGEEEFPGRGPDLGYARAHQRQRPVVTGTLRKHGPQALQPGLRHVLGEPQFVTQASGIGAQHGALPDRDHIACACGARQFQLIEGCLVRAE